MPVVLVGEVVRTGGKTMVSWRVMKIMAKWAVIVGSMVVMSGDWRAEIRNYRNIMQVRDHSENIGLFWYIFVEIFRQHVSFYRNLYLLFLAVLSGQIIMNLTFYTRVIATYDGQNKSKNLAKKS